MFAIEIEFNNATEGEAILVNRPQALIGGNDSCHIVVDDMSAYSTQLRLIRKEGRNFLVKTIGKEDDTLPALNQVFHKYSKIKFGEVKFSILALDIDLQIDSSLPPDVAAVNIGRLALSRPINPFPALVIKGSDPVVISFPKNMQVMLGRSRGCHVRLDSADVSGKHARIGYEDNKFWIEDLGSTNGTFVGQKQVSGRVEVNPMEKITLGKEIQLYIAVNSEQIPVIMKNKEDNLSPSLAQYPVVISVSDSIRPAKIALTKDKNIVIGRDPKSNIWIGAPHISRRHGEIKLLDSGKILYNDYSTNGTAYQGGILKKGDSITIDNEPVILNFGSNLTLAICFNKEQEDIFIDSGGSFKAFSKGKVNEKIEEEHKIFEEGTINFNSKSNIDLQQENNYMLTENNNDKKALKIVVVLTIVLGLIVIGLLLVSSIM